MLTIDNMGGGYLKDVAKWAHMLAILGYIGIGFLVVAGLLMGTIMGSLSHLSGAGSMGMLSGTVFTVIYLIIAIVYFFPVYFLHRFAVKMKLALRGQNQEALNESLRFLKSHYQYIGIMAIIMIAIYVIVFGIAAVSMAAMSHAM